MSDENIKGISEEETAELQEEISEEIAEETAEETAEEAVEETCEENKEEADETVETDETSENPENPDEIEDVTEEIPAEETAETIDEENLCPYCGENEKAEDSDYCPECEAAMLSRKIPFLAWLGGLAAVCVSVFALALVFLLTAPSIQVAKADKYARDNCWYSAYEEYSAVASVVEELSSILGGESPFVKTGTGIAVKKFDAFAKYTSPLDAFYVEGANVEHLRDKHNFTMKKHFEIYDEYMSSYEVVSAALQEKFGSDANPGAEEIQAAVEELRGTEGLSEIWLDYYHLTFAYDFNQSDEIKLGYLKAIDENAKKSDIDYSWLYYTEIADFLYKTDDYEGASEYLDKLITKDRSNFGAHELKMRILLKTKGLDEAKKLLDEFLIYNEDIDTAYILEIMYLRCAKEYDKAIELCTEALEVYGSAPELNRQLALLYLLKGDYDKAYDSVYTAYSNAVYIANYYQDESSLTTQLYNTLYLCAYLESEFGSMSAENTAEIGEILNSLEVFAETESVADVISGKKTVEQVLTEGEFDLI